MAIILDFNTNNYIHASFPFNFSTVLVASERITMPDAREDRQQPTTMKTGLSELNCI